MQQIIFSTNQRSFSTITRIGVTIKHRNQVFPLDVTPLVASHSQQNTTATKLEPTVFATPTVEKTKKV